MNLVGLALRNLKRRPIRTCLSILGIGLAVGSALALIALSRSIQDSTREGMDEIGDDLVVMQKGSSDIFGGFIPEETVDRIAALPGIVRVSGELVTFAPSGFANSVLTLGWPDASYLWKKVPLREGRVPAAGERRVAVLGDTAAASLGKKLDDDLELIGQTFRVVGIAAYTTTVNRGLVLVPLIDLQEASYRRARSPSSTSMSSTHPAAPSLGACGWRSRRSARSPHRPPTRCSTTTAILRSSRRSRWRSRSSRWR
jgi:putative ABC transport system permease protein